MSDFGGLMRLTVNGNPLTLRTKFESEPSAVELDGGPIRMVRFIAHSS